ncbi:MAG: histidine phosphatase family protein [Deltaproteobacteria bacterium]|nr:histidine phosphatase family protein [Deltaproteobacteria bacterium]
MVGLPARRKTFLSLKLQRYFEWQGYRIRIFNVGGYRRDISGFKSSTSDFFDPRARAFAQERERIAKQCFSDLAVWLRAEGDIAIYDATNVTSARREYLISECLRNGFDYIFVENICDDPEILEKIVSSKVNTSADYKDKKAAWAKKDFWERIRHYESVYETVGEGLPNIRLFNFGERISKNFDPGHSLYCEIAELLESVNLNGKNIYITRHGETFFNLEDRIGGDSPLTEKGVDFAKKLNSHFTGRDLIIFTSNKRRAVETASFFDCEKVCLEELNEINSGICDSMTYDEIAERYPAIHDSRKTDKFHFRYPQGESYRDLIQRLKKAILRIESQRKDVLVIAHRAVNRCLFSYFIPFPQGDIPYIEMPLNKIIRIHSKDARYAFEELSI